jgi:hypothetical protein
MLFQALALCSDYGPIISLLVLPQTLQHTSRVAFACWRRFDTVTSEISFRFTLELFESPTAKTLTK